MRRTLFVTVLIALMVLGMASAALAAQNQPGRGDNSTGRNDAGFGGGPHCHVLMIDSAQAQFEYLRVFPSHTAHAASGLPNRVFAADGNCNGLPGSEEVE